MIVETTEIWANRLIVKESKAYRHIVRRSTAAESYGRVGRNSGISGPSVALNRRDKLCGDRIVTWYKTPGVGVALSRLARVGETRLTEIDELFYGERRGVELRVEVQHLADVVQTVSRELHPGGGVSFTSHIKTRRDQCWVRRACRAGGSVTRARSVAVPAARCPWRTLAKGGRKARRSCVFPR